MDYQEPLSALHFKMDLANRFALALHHQGMTRKQLADRMGVTKGYITQVLSGDENLSLETIAKISDALECRIDTILVPKEVNEWGLKKILGTIEASFWNNKGDWIVGEPNVTTVSYHCQDTPGKTPEPEYASPIAA